MAATDRHKRDAGLAVGGSSAALFTGTNRLSNAVNDRYRSRVGAKLDRLEGARGLDWSGRPVGDVRPKLDGTRRRPGDPARRKGVNRRLLNRIDRQNQKRLQGARNDLSRRYRRGAITPHGRSMIQRTTLPLAIGGTLYGLHHSVDKADYSRRDVDLGGVGAGAGMLAYQGGGYALKPLDRRAERKIKASPVHRSVLAEHRRVSGLPPNAHAGHRAWTGYFRDYPKHLPGAKLKRTLARTHTGPSGAALTLAVGGLSGMETARLSRRARTGRSQSSVGKRYDGPDIVLKADRLVAEHKSTSLLRAAGYGTGVASLAWGGSRLRYLGPALRASKEVLEPTKPTVGRYLHRAENMRRNVERSTTAFGHAFGVGVGRLPMRAQVQLKRIPGPQRPLAATIAGGALVHVSSPVRRRTYTPVGD